MMRFAAVPGYSQSFPVTYRNMYNDYQMQTAGFSDPFNMTRKEQHSPCDFVVSYTGEDDPRFQLNNPAYMREVTRSHADNIPPVILNKRPIQARWQA
tara:strand:- start:8893 stop:9183 length:291 start_codon:yes stop_codon:yes gene_type:complete